VQALLPVLEREQAHHELAVAWRLVMLSHGIAGRYRQASDAAVHSIAYARQAGDSRLIAKVGGILTNTALLGTTPVGQAIEQCEQLIAGGLDDQLVEGNTLCVLAELRAMNGEFDVAQTLVYQGRSKLRDLENGVSAAASGISVAHVELLRGNLAHAEQLVRQDYQFLSRIGETYYLSSVAAVLARLVRDQGRDDEAMEFSKAAEAATAADDMESQVAWRAVRAPILARAGRLDEAEALARSAVDLALQTEAVNLQASALLELATVLGTAARSDEAGGLAERALRIYLDKGNLAAAERARALHARLRPA
jgi:ATP/maltotriose-dependent transcriptional regulator MalT